MKKNKLLIPIVSLLMVGMISGCSDSSSSISSSSGYPVYTGDDHNLTYQKTEGFVSSYKNGDLFCTKGLDVFFDGSLLTHEQYFFTSDAQCPEENVLTEENVMSSSKREITATYFVAFCQDGYTYVSEGIDVTVTNSSAVDNWVYYTMMGLVLVGLGIWTFVKTKAKKEGRA